MTESNETEVIMNMVSRIIKLANEMKDEGVEVEVVNAALQLASGNYSTYLAAGNNGYLKASGIEKVTEAYKENLIKLQELKKQQLNLEAKG